MTTALVLTEPLCGDAALKITISREHSRNALNRQVITELLAAFKIAINERLQVVLLCGAGEEAFCAGADLKELQESNTRQRRAFFTGLAELLNAMLTCPAIVVTRIHGYALAGGCGLVAASDLAFASDQAKFGLPEIKLGMVPAVVMTPLHARIGARALSRLSLTGEIIDAQEALRIGLVSNITRATELTSKVDSEVALLASRSPEALGLAKRALRSLDSRNMHRTMRTFAKTIAKFSEGPSCREGIAAFLEKRPPRWPTKNG